MNTSSKITTDIIGDETTLTVAIHSASAGAKPHTIEINELSSIAFARAAVLIRDGYRFCPHNMPEVFGFTGQAAITLVLADPDAEAIAGAADSMAFAVDRLTIKTEQDAAAELAATEEHQRKEAAKVIAAAELAAAKLLVRRLEAAQKRM